MNSQTIYKFRLYITGQSPNSVQAQANLRALCQTHLADRFEIEVLDVLKEPMLALKDSVLFTPTLLKLSPLPVRKIVGALSDVQTVLNVMVGLEVIEC